MGRLPLPSNIKNPNVELELEFRLRHIQEEAHEKYFNSLSAFVRDGWSILEPATPYKHGWHLDVMCDHLQAVTDGKIKRLLINIPPGTMKSLLVSVFWAAWEWGVRKLHHYRYIGVSHSKNLSIRDSMRMRDLVGSEWYQNRFPHVVIRSDQDTKEKFVNTYTGFRQANASTTVTGARGDRLIFDDPLSVEDAESETIRESVNRVFQETLQTRLNDPDKSAMVGVMQRLHENDVSGLILAKKMPFEHLCLPMEFEPDIACETSLGFKDPRTERGELLFPSRFPTHVVKAYQEEMGAYAYAGQFQQSPAPRDGSILKNSWIKLYSHAHKPFTLIFQAWDTAFKTQEQHDYSVGGTWGILDGEFYLIDRRKGKFDFPALLKEVRNFHDLHEPRFILIEDKASGQSLIQTMKTQFNGVCKITPYKPDSDKITRVHAISYLFEKGKVNIREAPWTQDYINNLLIFPKGKHDDDVDMTSMTLAYGEKFIKENKNKKFTYDYMQHVF